MKLFKFGLELFDGSSKKYGGHSRLLAKLFGRTIGVHALRVYLRKDFRMKIDYDYYDCHRYFINIGWIGISFEGFPFWEREHPRP